MWYSLQEIINRFQGATHKTNLAHKSALNAFIRIIKSKMAFDIILQSIIVTAMNRKVAVDDSTITCIGFSFFQSTVSA